MESVIFVLQLFSCIFLIGIILLQRGKGADMGAAFGGASQTVFGSRGPATFLNKLTVIVAAVFLASSVYLAQVAKHKQVSSVVDKEEKASAEAIEKEPATDAVPAVETPATEGAGEKTEPSPAKGAK